MFDLGFRQLLLQPGKYKYHFDDISVYVILPYDPDKSRLCRISYDYGRMYGQTKHFHFIESMEHVEAVLFECMVDNWDNRL